MKDLGVQAAESFARTGSFVTKEITDTFAYFKAMMGPPPPALAGYGNVLGFLDQKVVKNATDSKLVQAMSEAMGNDNFAQAVGGWAAKYGDDTAAQITGVVDRLGKAQIEALANANKMDIVADGIKQSGWSKESVEGYAKWVQELGPDNPFVKNLDELAQNGVKFDPQDVVEIQRAANGGLIFLERGSAKAGLQHILDKHAKDFVNRSIPVDQIR